MKKKSVKNKGSKTAASSANPPKPSTYQGHDLSMLPAEAYPQESRRNLGKHSYTIGDGDAVAEVLLHKKAFFVKRVGNDGTGPVGQVSWSKHGGPKAAWKVLLERSGLVLK